MIVRINGRLIATALVALGIIKIAKDGIPKEELQSHVIYDEDEENEEETQASNENTF
jgi:hypothetical protein